MTADQPHAATRKDSQSKAADHAMSSTGNLGVEDVTMVAVDFLGPAGRRHCIGYLETNREISLA